jgi:hypothetical protein
MDRAGLPGSTWLAKKMMTLSKNSVRMARPKRFRRYLANGSP